MVKVRKASLIRLSLLMAIVMAGVTPAVILLSFSSSPLSDLEDSLGGLSGGNGGNDNSDGDDNGEDGDENGDQSGDESDRAVPSESTSESDEEEGEEDNGGYIVYTDNPPDDPVYITSYRVDQDSVLDNDVLNIIGEIRNNDSVSAEFVEIVATFYDSTNSTLGSDFTFTDPSELEPGQSAPFEMNAGAFKNLPVDDVRYIKFHVDWQ